MFNSNSVIYMLHVFYSSQLNFLRQQNNVKQSHSPLSLFSKNPSDSSPVVSVLGALLGFCNAQ